MPVARERSLGKGVSQKLVGGHTRRLYKRSDVRCHFLKNNRLFDGEARCCKSVDNHTTVTSARVAPTTRAAERAGIQTGKVAACLARMLTLLPLRLPTWAFAVLHLVSQHFRSIILRLLWACSIFMIGSTHAQCSHVFYSQRNGPEEDGRTRCSGLGQRAAPQALFCKHCEGSATLATMKRWNQYRGELHAPPHIPRRPTSWERLVYGVPIEQSNRLGCQRPGCGHVTMMGSKTAPSSLQAIYRHVLSPSRCVTGPSW